MDKEKKEILRYMIKKQEVLLERWYDYLKYPEDNSILKFSDKFVEKIYGEINFVKAIAYVAGFPKEGTWIKSKWEEDDGWFIRKESYEWIEEELFATICSKDEHVNELVEKFIDDVNRIVLLNDEEIKEAEIEEQKRIKRRINNENK